MLDANNEFTLIDSQKVVSESADEHAQKANKHNEKHFLIVEGGPGTGKTVVAMNIFAELIQQDPVDHIGLGEASAWRGCAVWRRLAAAGAASWSGRSWSSARWYSVQPGQHLVFVGLFQRTNYLTWILPVAAPRSGVPVVSGDTVASGTICRRQRLSRVETYWHHLCETVRSPLRQIQRLLDKILRISM